MEQISTKTQVSVLQYWFLQEHCKNIFIYLSVLKWVKMYYITISVSQWYIENPVCLLLLNRSFEAHCCFIFIFYFTCICGRKDWYRIAMLFLKTALCLHFVLISSADLIEPLILAHPGIPPWNFALESKESKMWLIIDCWPDSSLIPAITLFSHGILDKQELLRPGWLGLRAAWSSGRCLCP